MSAYGGKKLSHFKTLDFKLHKVALCTILCDVSLCKEQPEIICVNKKITDKQKRRCQHSSHTVFNSCCTYCISYTAVDHVAGQGNMGRIWHL